jgi:dihydroorotase
MLGLEIAASVAQLVLVDSENRGWDRVAQVLSHNPANIGLLSEQGQPLEAGSFANITLIDPSAKREISGSHSKSDNNPYRGMTLPGEVKYTFFRGYPTLVNGAVASEGNPNAR